MDKVAIALGIALLVGAAAGASETGALVISCAIGTAALILFAMFVLRLSGQSRVGTLHSTIDTDNAYDDKDHNPYKG